MMKMTLIWIFITFEIDFKMVAYLIIWATTMTGRHNSQASNRTDTRSIDQNLIIMANAVNFTKTAQQTNGTSKFQAGSEHFAKFQYIIDPETKMQSCNSELCYNFRIDAIATDKNNRNIFLFRKNYFWIINCNDNRQGCRLPVKLPTMRYANLVTDNQLFGRNLQPNLDAAVNVPGIYWFFFRANFVTIFSDNDNNNDHHQHHMEFLQHLPIGEYFTGLKSSSQVNAAWYSEADQKVFLQISTDGLVSYRIIKATNSSSSSSSNGSSISLIMQHEPNFPLNHIDGAIFLYAPHKYWLIFIKDLVYRWYENKLNGPYNVLQTTFTCNCSNINEVNSSSRTEPMAMLMALSTSKARNQVINIFLLIGIVAFFIILVCCFCFIVCFLIIFNHKEHKRKPYSTRRSQIKSADTIGSKVTEQMSDQPEVLFELDKNKQTANLSRFSYNSRE